MSRKEAFAVARMGPVHLQDSCGKTAWVVAAAKCGSEDGFDMTGGSAIVAPTGALAAKAISEDDEVITRNCDLGLGTYIRRSVFDCKRHRRPEHYGAIVNRVGIEVSE